MTETVSTAVAKVEQPSPSSIVASYSSDISRVLPSHVKPDTWVRIAQGALKKGKKVATRIDGKLVQVTELELAAMNNPGVFMATIMDAARLGLEPGTDEYYLTARNVGKQLQILGIVGYQGYIELMYRAGAISSVVAECVYSNDVFTYRPGRDPVPNHDIDWDADDRGSLRLVYAYAIMRDGATSKVVVLNKAAIDKIKQDVYIGKDSPWLKHEPSMWLKSGIRQLRKWVPTSTEYRIPAAPDAPAVAPAGFAPALEGPKHLGDEWVESDVEIHDGEIVEDVDEEPPAVDTAAPTKTQLARLHAQLADCGVEEAGRHATLGLLAGRPITSASQLTHDEVTTINETLARCTKTDNPVAALDSVLSEIGAA